MKKRIAALVSGAGALAILAGGYTIANANKSVELSIDGVSSQTSSYGSTVADLLEQEGVELGEHDLVVPSPETKLSDGQVISVAYGREVTVSIDGETKSIWTTAITVAEVLPELGLEDVRNDISVARSSLISREGLHFVAETPTNVILIDGGKKQTVASTADTVKDILTELGVSVNDKDVLKPSADTKVTEGMTIDLKRVTTKQVTETKTVAHSTQKTNTSELAKGKTKVATEGKDGEKKVTYEVTYIDGKESKRKTVKEVVTTKPVTEKVLVGTYVESSSSDSSGSGSSSGSSSGAALNLAMAATWDRIAQCESSGNWSINTGNGYYGGLQFNLATWRSVNGGDFAAYPHQATRAEQITVANRLHAQRGFQPWSCA